jgi:hypothetical protein
MWPFDDEEEPEDVLDPQMAARAAGYSWGEIWDHIAGATQTALGFGYTEPEVDRHLGYRAPPPGSYAAQWGGLFSADPGLRDGAVAEEPKLDLAVSPTLASDYAEALRNREVKGPRDFTDAYAAAAMAEADDGDESMLLQRQAVAAGAANAIVPFLPTNEDLTDATLALLDRETNPNQVRSNLIDNWRDTGQHPLEAAMAAENDPKLHDRLTAPPALGALQQTYDAVLKAAGYTAGLAAELPLGAARGVAKMVIDLEHIAEAVLPEIPALRIAAYFGDVDVPALVAEHAAVWKEREDRWGRALAGTDWQKAGTDPAGFAMGVIGETVPTVAAYVAAGIPAMIAYGVMVGADHAFRETGSWAAAGAGAVIGGLAAGAPAPFLKGAAGKGLIDNAVRGAAGMGLVGGIQSVADTIPRAIGTGEWSAISWEGVPEGVVRGAIGGSLIGTFGGIRQMRARVIDSSKPPGETDTDVPLREALEPVRPAAFELQAEGDTGAPRFVANASPAAKLARIAELELENRGVLPNVMEMGDFFQRRLAEMGETDKATVELAAGYQTAGGVLRFVKGLMGDLLTDTRGSGKGLEEIAALRRRLGIQPPARGQGNSWDATIGEDGAVTFEGIARPPPPTPKADIPKSVTMPPSAVRVGPDPDTGRPWQARRPVGTRELKDQGQDWMVEIGPDDSATLTGTERRPPPFPENTSANREATRDVLRGKGALGEQLILHFGKMIDETRVKLNPHMPEWLAANEAGEGQMNTVIGQAIRAFEGRSTYLDENGQRQIVRFAPNDQMKPVFETFGHINEALYDLAQQRVAEGTLNAVGYVKDYWSHLWTDPNAAVAAWHGSGGGQGRSAGLVEQRSIPTIEDGLALGLKLKIPDVGDLMLYDVSSKIKFLTHLDTMARLEDLGIVVRSVGDRLPFEGAERIVGRSTERITPDGIEYAWAPAAAARLYNNALAQGWYSYPQTGSTFQKLMWAKNTSVGTKLILPIFHSFVIAEQTLATGMQLAMSELGKGNFSQAAVEVAKTVSGIKAKEMAQAGMKAMRDYANLTGDPIVQMLVESGARFGKRQLPYQTGASGYHTLIAQNKGHVIEAAAREIVRDVKSLGGPEGEALWQTGAMLVPRVAGIGLHEMQKIATTTSAPLFDYAIPTLKAGAAVLRAQQYLRLHPEAKPEAVQTRMRQIIDSIDDRFGEMNQDNLFWNKWVKQTANAGSISTSWAYGAWRQILSGIGYNVERGVEWNPEATSALVSALIVYGGANAIMQMLNGQGPPRDVWDILNFRTGGVDRFGNEQRGLLPTAFKEIYDMGRVVINSTLDPFSVPQGLVHYIQAKENPVVQAFTALITGHDAVGHRIANTPGGWPGYFMEQVKPIIINNIQGEPPGTGLNTAERTFIREAPDWVQNVQGYIEKQTKLHERWTKEELRRATREATEKGLELPEGANEVWQGGGSQGRAERGLARRQGAGGGTANAIMLGATLRAGRRGGGPVARDEAEDALLLGARSPRGGRRVLRRNPFPASR